MKPRVYIETSVISYLTAWPARDLIVAAHQQITREWWRDDLARYEAYVSAPVLEEIAAGDAEAARVRLDAIKDLLVLRMNDDIKNLGQEYLDALKIPAKAATDAMHMAVATYYRMEYLISWNCGHIVNAAFIRRLARKNNQLGYKTPVICTPESLRGTRDD